MRSLVGDGKTHHPGVKVLHLFDIPGIEPDVADCGSGLTGHGYLPFGIRTDHGWMDDRMSSDESVD